MGLSRKVGGCDARACRNIGRIESDDRLTIAFAGVVLAQMLQDRRQEHAVSEGVFIMRAIIGEALLPGSRLRRVLTQSVANASIHRIKPSSRCHNSVGDCGSGRPLL